MKVFTVLAALLATLSAAQVDPGKVNPCILNCASDSATGIGCSSVLDVNCICGDKKGSFTEKAAPCIISKCGQDKLNEALGLLQELCTKGIKQ